jgi:hypothetical protein
VFDPKHYKKKKGKGGEGGREKEGEERKGRERGKGKEGRKGRRREGKVTDYVRTMKKRIVCTETNVTEQTEY